MTLFTQIPTIKPNGELGALLVEHLLVILGGLIIGSLSLSYLHDMHDILALKREVYRIQQFLKQQWNSSVITGQRGLIHIAESSLQKVHSSGSTELYRLPDNTRFSNSSTRIYFSPHGVTTPRTVTLLREEARCSIIISLYGRIRHRCWAQ